MKNVISKNSRLREKFIMIYMNYNMKKRKINSNNPIQNLFNFEIRIGI